METVIMLAAALLPAVVLWLCIWKKDMQPEPTSRLLKAVLWGMMICIPVAFLEIGMQYLFWGGEPTTLLGTTIDAFVVTALPEECFKLLALWMVLRKNPYFDEHFDGIVYAVCVGMGFAAFENVAYIFGEENWFSTAIVRALFSVPGHYAFAILMGYYYSLYHFVDCSLKNAFCILAVPVMAHGIFDALVFASSVNPYEGGIYSTALIFFCIKLHKIARTKVLEQIDRDRVSELSD